MNNEQKKSGHDKFNLWLANLSYAAVLITLILIMVQVYYAKQTMVEANEWEKAKVTIEDIERLKENLKGTALYGKNEVLWFADKLWPDFTNPQKYELSDTLRIIYSSLFDSREKFLEDFEKSLAILDAFAYPIIMGYASEMGAYQSVGKDYFLYGNYIMPIAFHDFPNIGHYAKLLFRLWRVRYELMATKDPQGFIDKLKNSPKEYSGNITNYMLCFDGSEITPASIEKYHEKLEKELKKIQKEIEVFRENSLK